MLLFFVSLLPATLGVIIGYFVLFSSSRAEGGTKRLGQFLSIWLFVLSGGVVVGALAAPALGFGFPNVMGEMTRHMQTMEHQEDQILEELRKKN